MFLVLLCDIGCDDKMVYANMSYFAFERPQQVGAFLIACRAV